MQQHGTHRSLRVVLALLLAVAIAPLALAETESAPTDDRATTEFVPCEDGQGRMPGAGVKVGDTEILERRPVPPPQGAESTPAPARAPVVRRPAPCPPAPRGTTPGAGAKAGDTVIIDRRPVPAGRPATAMPAPMPAPQGETQPAPMPSPIPMTGDPEIDRLRMRAAVERDKIRFVVEQQLEMARAHIQAGEYQAAEEVLLAAQELDPANREVRSELRDVQAYLGRRPADAGDMLDTVREMQRVRIDQQRTTASRLVNLGRQHLSNRRFDDAIETFEQAQFIIESSPYQIDWNGLDDQVEQGLIEARRMKIESERAAQRARIEGSLAEMAAAEEQRLIAEQQRLERLLGSGIEAFQRGDYEAAQFYAEKVLDAQPDNTKARDLQLSARRAQHDQLHVEYLRKEKQAFRDWWVDIQQTRVLQDRILKWPSQNFWERITEVRKRSRTSIGGGTVDPEAEALRDRIRSTNVTLQIEEQSFMEVTKLMQLQTGINVVIDPRVAPDVGEASVNGLYVEDMPLETVLELLVGYAGEQALWTTRGNMVWFTHREFLPKNLVTRIQSVTDLTAGLTDFIPPTIQLVSPDMVSDEDQPLFGAEGEEPLLPYGTIDELMELIKSSVNPLFWEETEGADIRGQGEGMLVVVATPEMQERVENFLDDLRAFAGIVVTVESRFLEVGDYFLRDVGVDFRGLGGQTPGPLVNLDDVTNGLTDQASAGYDNGGGGLTTGAALNPSSGIYFDDGLDGDFRGRTENIFENSLGTVLSALGGGSFTFSYLGDTDIAMILRATEKDAKARTLTAPTVTVFNTQRANLTVVNQLSYIQDFDVEVAQTSFIADPIVGIIQDGLTLDVRPTVSNDRRYITLELQPTVANLLEPIPTFATSLASTFAPVIIQLPELNIQQARVTVRIPDKGSILIGGLKNIRTVDRSSEVPFLARIPVLSFFFSRKGRSDEITHLMILVRAEITDLREQQEQLMGGALDGDGPYALPPSPFHAEATYEDPCAMPAPMPQPVEYRPGGVAQPCMTAPQACPPQPAMAPTGAPPVIRPAGR